jgi:hypothetical protein
VPVPPDALDLDALAAALAPLLAERLSAGCPDEHRLIGRAELARRLGVSERTVGVLLAPEGGPAAVVAHDWHGAVGVAGGGAFPRGPARPKGPPPGARAIRAQVRGARPSDYVSV